MSQSQPNVLLVVADQHNASWMGCAGHAQAITPRLDAFAAEGRGFDAAYCQNPICTPSRTSLLSGQYCHNHGVYGLSGPAPLGTDNLFRRFRAAGYLTAGFGKLHLPDAPHNWIRDDVDRFGDTYETPDGVHGRSEFFDYLTGLGLRDLEDSWHNTKAYGAKSIPTDACVSELPYEHTQEAWCAREALKTIDAAGAQGRPFCVQVAMQKPHHPLTPQRRFWEMYPDDLDLPPTVEQDPSHRPPHFQGMVAKLRQYPWEFASDGESWVDGARRSWKGTLACVTQVDDVFGMLLDGLAERGLDENTIVIYTSDHGAYHTVHGIEEKAPGICSEAVCRVPMIWRVPGITPAGTRTRQLVELVDLFPTLSAMCGLETPDSADGLDISAIVAGGEEPVRDTAVTEHPWSKAIRWDRWRYVHYPRGMFPDSDHTPGGGFAELYDLDADPDETRNLALERAHHETVAEAQRRLTDWLIQTTRLATEIVTPRHEDAEGRGHYPMAGDGRARREHQPRFKANDFTNYL